MGGSCPSPSENVSMEWQERDTPLQLHKNNLNFNILFI